MVKRCIHTAESAGSIPAPPTNNELIGFFEANMRDARSASQWFPPNFPNEFRIFGALARTDFSPRRRFEIRSEEFALSENTKRIFAILNLPPPKIAYFNDHLWFHFEQS